MTNDQKWATTIQQATVDQIVKFFRDRHVSENCGLCGSTDWGIDKQISQDYYSYNTAYKTSNGEAELKDARVTPVIQLACTNCGNVRQHSFEVFKGWMQDRASKSDHDD